MMVLIGDELYCQHYDNDEFSTLHKIPAAGSREEIELSKDIVETASVVDHTIYYSGLGCLSEDGGGSFERAE